MRVEQVVLVNRLGLHARAAGKLVHLTKTFSSRITLSRNSEEVDGKSIMAVMLLAAPVGTELTLTVEGEDEDEALDAVKRLISDRFGEED
ncbi:MAG: HPr family phosphocarrier protein [Pseudomonadales bacterium]